MRKVFKKLNLNKCFLLILCLLGGLFVELQAQQSTKKVTGRVMDEDGELLIGVTILEAGTTNGTITDIDGAYSIDVASGKSKLVFSYVGLESQEIIVGADNIIDVTMKIVPNKFDEIVVVGYGTQRKISSMGAQSSIKVAEIKQPVANLSTTLAGRLAGVVAVQRSGEPGKDNSDIWIRGISTPGASNPLILVDGVERSMDNIDPEDIESFTILKDASATAVYGVRGANGVIIIKTKPGVVGKPSISVDYYEGISRLTKKPKLADGITYMTAVNEAYANRSEIGPYTATDFENTSSGVDPLRYPNINWLDQVFDDMGHNRRVNVNLRGGSQNANYYASVSYYNEEGLIKTNPNETYDSKIGYSRYNFTTNLNIKATPTTQVDLGVSGYLGEGRKPYESTSDIFRVAMTTSPVEMPFMFVIDGKEYVPYNQNNAGFHNAYVGATMRGYETSIDNQIYSNLRLTQDLNFVTEGLTASAMYAFDVFNTRSSKWRKNTSTYFWKDKENEPYDADGNPVIVRTYEGSNVLQFSSEGNSNRKYYLEASLNYARTFDKHSIGALLLYNQDEKVYSYDGITQISALPYRTRGFAGRATYSWADKYFAEFNVGINGSENFAPSKRYGTFPAFGIGWVPSNEEFWQPISNAFSFLKIRYTNGWVGNQATDRRFLYLEALEYNSGYGYTWGDGGTNGYNVLNDPIMVTWEKSHKQDLGIDMKFLKDDLSLTVDLFKEYRKGVFVDRGKVPDFAGITTMPIGNLQEVENKGYEIDLEYNKRIDKDWFISVRGNLTYAKNKVTENDQPDPEYPWMSQIGQGILSRKGLVAQGLYTQDEIDQIEAWKALSSAEKATTPRPFPTQFGDVYAGDIKYQDLNGDGVIDDKDEKYIGYGDVPQYVYGFGFNIQYKNIALATLFQGTANADRYLNGTGIQPFSETGGVGSLYSNITDRWTTENPSQDVFYPRLAYGADKNQNNFRSSTWWQKDMSFLRLKSVQVTYTLPKSFVNSIYLKNASVYFMGTNLFTLSKFKLWDPELNTNNGTAYPNVSTYSIGVNVNF